MALLMPITSPFRFRSGPPELPGLMAVSVWMMSALEKYATRGVGDVAGQRPPQGRDDAGGHGAAQSEGVADGDHGLPDLQGTGIAHG